MWSILTPSDVFLFFVVHLIASPHLNAHACGVRWVSDGAQMGVRWTVSPRVHAHAWMVAIGGTTGQDNLHRNLPSSHVQ